MHLRVALLGFTDTERHALGAHFRLSANRIPSYVQVHMLTDADYLVADADHSPSVQLVVATERLAETVFVGAQAPGSAACLPRPIDALRVMRELDALVVRGFSAAGSGEGRGTTFIEVPGRPPADPVVPDIELLAEPGPIGSTAPLSAALPVISAVTGHELMSDLFAPSPPVLDEVLDKALDESLLSAPPAPRRKRPTPAAPPPRPTPRALLVDDSALALRFLHTRLLPWGLEVDEADGSARAIEMLAQRPYDLVFLDVELGEASALDGLALCQHIKQSAAIVNAAVVLVSAHHSELDRVRGALAGCDAYLGKPLDEVELARVLVRQGLKKAAPVSAPNGQ